VENKKTGEVEEIVVEEKTKEIKEVKDDENKEDEAPKTKEEVKIVVEKETKEVKENLFIRFDADENGELNLTEFRKMLSHEAAEEGD